MFVPVTSIFLGTLSVGQAVSTSPPSPGDVSQVTMPMDDCLMHLDEARHLDTELFQELISGLSLVCPHFYDGITTLDQELLEVPGATSTVEPVPRRRKRKTNNDTTEVSTLTPSLRGSAVIMTTEVPQTTTFPGSMLRGSRLSTTGLPAVDEFPGSMLRGSRLSTTGLPAVDEFPDVTMPMFSTDLMSTTTSTISPPDVSTSTLVVSADDDDDDDVYTSIFATIDAPKTNLRTTLTPSTTFDDTPKGGVSSNALPLVVKLSLAALMWWLF